MWAFCAEASLELAATRLQPFRWTRLGGPHVAHDGTLSLLPIVAGVCGNVGMVLVS